MERIGHVTVYRMEDADGVGMYYKGDSFGGVATDIMGYDAQNHPVPQDDSLLQQNLKAQCGTTYIGCGYHFGFSSLEQLRRWVYQDDWLVALAKNGILIAEYSVPVEDVCLGHTQTLFMRGVDTIKKQYNLIEYFNLKENN